MPRPVHFFQPLWLDSHFRKAFKSLHPQEQSAREQELAGLIAALASCRHPASDPDLRPWKPTAYRIARVTGLFEYRGRFPLRVIARFIDPDPPELPDGAVLLVAATLTHDHDRLKRILEAHRAELSR